MKLIFFQIFVIISFVAVSDTYMCQFPCTTDIKKTCSHYYTRINKNSFYEDKKWKIFKARENEDHLLLTRIGFPTEGDLPEYVFVEDVYIDTMYSGPNINISLAKFFKEGIIFSKL